MSDDARTVRRRNLIVTNPSPQNDDSEKSVNNYFIRVLNRFPAVPGPVECSRYSSSASSPSETTSSPAADESSSFAPLLDRAQDGPDPPIPHHGTPPAPNSRAPRVNPPFRNLPRRPPTPPAIDSIVKTVIVVSKDSDWYAVVDISGATNATFIRERIFKKLNIRDGEISRFAIYQTEFGASAIGESLTDEKLFVCCRDEGDSKGSLKFLVTDAPPPVHQLRQPIPFPVLSSFNSTDFGPLHQKRRSRHASVSPNQQHRLESSGVYEADLDNSVCGHDINKPLPPTPLRPLPSPQHHPLSNDSPSLPHVCRFDEPLPRPPHPQSPQFTSSSPTETSRSEFGNANLRQIAAVPLLSPTFATNENVVPHPAYRFRGRTGSDEQVEALRVADYDRDVGQRKLHTLDARLSPQPFQESLSSSTPLNDRWNRITSEDLVRSNSWVVVPPPVSRSDDQDLQSTTQETTSYVSQHQSATRPSPPLRPSVTVPYTGRRLPVPPRHLPPVPNTACKTHETCSPAPRISASVPLPSNNTKTIQWNRLAKGSKSVDNLRNFKQATSTIWCQAPPVPSYPSHIPGVSRSYDSRPIRPLPTHGSTIDLRRDAFNSRDTSCNTVLPNQDPYPGPKSASGDSTSLTRRPRVQSLTYIRVHLGDNVRDRSSDMSSGIAPSYSTPPHTPISPRSPLNSHQDQSSPSRQSTSDSKTNDLHDFHRGLDSTLRPEDQQWIAATLNGFSEGTLIASRARVGGKIVKLKLNTSLPTAESD